MEQVIPTIANIPQTKHVSSPVPLYVPPPTTAPTEHWARRPNSTLGCSQRGLVLKQFPLQSSLAKIIHGGYTPVTTKKFILTPHDLFSLLCSWCSQLKEKLCICMVIRPTMGEGRAAAMLTLGAF